ncbi:probable apyrase 6 [Impatiens glandulifera]|uniref:probable apyrase 6 n=1 Tax=Impatiens glandulifera TaxID=253017 RepID=UPI001FB0FCE9|nr:probable apyrase 6 [Impatiens glandulifera]
MRRSNVRSANRKRNGNMDAMKLQFRQSTPHRLNLFPRNSKQTFPTSSRLNIVIYASVAISAALFCYVFYKAMGDWSSEKRKFGIVIDGGSTGTRVHVFDYVVKAGVSEFNFRDKGLVSMRVNPGLSSYADDPDKAGRSLERLIEFGKKIVPEELWGETEVRLMATAGLRMLNLSVQDRILDSCRRILRSSTFKFQDSWASVITGTDEGIYAWVVANYALGVLGGDPSNTTGIIELGGASAQVTFVSSEPMPPEFSHVVKVGNASYNLYSHSLLHYGQNVAFDILQESLGSTHSQSVTRTTTQTERVNDPCTPKGYVHLKAPSGSSTQNSIHPAGNFSECRSAALTLLQKGKEECVYQHCHIGSTFTPKLEGSFLATENFFHTSKFFGLNSKGRYISDMMRAGKKFCEDDWLNLRSMYHTLDEEDLMRYCFSSAYIVAFLHDSLGIAMDDERITIANQVRDIPLDWALGAFILQNTQDHPSWINIYVMSDSSRLIAFLIIFVLLMAGAWSLSKWRKPQVKTIYDLEKGKYIISRVNRYS